MPTGVPLRDARAHLFDAAERLLLRSGPAAVTSRSVTAEAGCAKGVLHRHFGDFDTFLAELVLDRADRMDPRLAGLPDHAGQQPVADAVAGALTALFESVAVAIVPLITLYDGVRARLRDRWPVGIPILTDAAELLTRYLAAERELGRIAADADVERLAPVLVGTGHLLYADRTGTPPTAAAVRDSVTTVLGGVLTDDTRPGRLRRRLRTHRPTAGH